jgi:DDE superfamily endonuclease
VERDEAAVAAWVKETWPQAEDPGRRAAGGSSSRKRPVLAEHDWLTVCHLPSYAPDLNPVEGVWSPVRHGPLANRIFADPKDLEQVLRRGLREIQYRPDLIDGVLAEPGLTIRTAEP